MNTAYPFPPVERSSDYNIGTYLGTSTGTRKVPQAFVGCVTP
jgi:hypothetical protein